MGETLSLKDIQTARQRIGAGIRRTLLRPTSTLSERLKTNVYVKLEMFQKTGSFKVRGAFNKALSLGPEQREHGIVAVSGGNHALAVAYVARALDLHAMILMPESTPPHFIEAARGYGAEVKFAASAAAAFSEVAAMEKENWVFIHPFDDPFVMAGQGTVGLEILEDLPHVTDVVLSVGGGGFAGGVATAIKSLKPAVRIWGVETAGADCMSKSLEAGKVVTLEGITSMARSLGAPAPSERTLALAQQFLESVTVVPDGETATALLYLLERLKVLAEPAAACTLAGADHLRGRFSPERHVVLVLSGGNYPVSDLQQLVP